jgi:hypothetical protein
MRRLIATALLFCCSCDSLVDWCMATGWKSPEQCEAMRNVDN